MNQKLPLMLLALLSGHLLFGQAGQSFLRLGVNEGLSQNSVREIFQDKQGFIWIGTGDGLNRYDGIQIKKYRQSLRDNSAKRFPGKILNGRIHQDEDGNLWMIVDGQLVKMDVATETFTVLKQVGRDLECAIIGIHSNEVYITNATGMQVVNIVDRTERKIDLQYVFGLYKPAKMQSYLLYWQGNSIYQYNNQAKEQQLLLQTERDIISCNFVSNASILLFEGKKVYEYNLHQRKITATYIVPDTTQYKEFGVVAKSKSGDIIGVIPSRGFVVIDSLKGSFHNYTNIPNDPYSLSSNLVHTAMVDHSNNMWLGTEGGGINILNLKPRLFNSFPAASVTNRESSFLMVKSLFHGDGKIYIGTYGKGLFIVDRQTLQYKTAFTPAKEHDPTFHGIFFIKKDRQGRIWMNSSNTFGILNEDKDRFLLSTSIEYIRRGKRHNIIQCFEQIADSTYIVGTVQSTYLVEEKGKTLSVTDLGLIDNRLEGDIQTLFKKDNGEIIIGKGEGKGLVVMRLEKDRKPVITSSDLDGLTVKYIRRDESRKAFWFATNVGIVIMKDGSTDRILIDEENGLSNDFIYSIIAEDDHTAWVSTNKGINRISFQKNDFPNIAKVEQYAIQHGLQSNEFNTGAYFKDGNLFFFGGVTGINWFDYRTFSQRSFSARSYITDLLINEKPLATDSAINFLQHVKLSYAENNLLIKFATLDYSNPSVNQYLYRLTGYDKSWIKAGNTPEARYSKLPPGTYTFEIISSNSEGVWSGPTTLLSIAIAPPFWLTWWFRVLASITLVAIVFYVARYFLKRKMKKQLRIMQQQLAVNNERLRISRDMHDELGTGLSKIALLSEVGKNQKAPDNNKIIQEISETSRKLAGKMGEIIWTLNPQNDTLGNLAAYLKEYIYEATESLPVSVNSDFPESIPDISLRHMLRQQLMLVTKEAVNNALKYSKASQIDFSLAVNEGIIWFSVKDNGIGFNTQTLDQSRNGKKNGLANMQARMAGIGGHFTIHSTPGNGTEIRYGINI